MAFSDPQSLTYNAVAKSLVLTSRGTLKSAYRVDDTGNTDTKFDLRIEHTAPSSEGSGEQHFVRLDGRRYDATTGEYLRTDSVWLVAKAADSSQVSQDLDYLIQMLVDWLTDGNIDKLLERES